MLTKQMYGVITGKSVENFAAAVSAKALFLLFVKHDGKNDYDKPGGPFFVPVGRLGVWLYPHAGVCAVGTRF